MSVTFDDDMRSKVFAKTDGHCAYCGRDLRIVFDWQIDHMIPRCQGGSDDLRNLIAACKRCNRSKLGRTPEEFREVIKERITRRINWAGQRFSDDTCIVVTDKAHVIDCLFAAYKAIEDAEVSFYIDDLTWSGHE